MNDIVLISIYVVTWYSLWLYISYQVIKSIVLLYVKKRAQNNIKYLQEEREKIIIKITTPKTNNKWPRMTEQLLESLHSLYKDIWFWESFKGTDYQEQFSFEIVQEKGNITFYIWTYNDLYEFLSNQIYAQYPNAEIEISDDYIESFRDFQSGDMVELELEENELYPVKTFNLLQGGSKDESIDSLSALLAPLSNLDHKQETIIFQYILTPEHEKWKESSHKLELAIEKQETIANKIASASKFPLLLNIALLPFSILVKIIQKLGKKEENTEEEQKESKGLSDKDKGKIQALQQKEEKPAFRCIIRAAYLRKDQDKSFSKTKMQSITGSFRQFNSQHNSFIHKKPFLKEGLWGKKRDLSFKEIYSLLKTRSFNKPGILLNIEEIASVYHLPNTNVNVPNIQYTPYQKLEAPVNLPTPENTDEDLTMMGYTNFRNQKKLFGMTPNDRRRHLYVIWKTGMGKSTILSNMIHEDIQMGRGVCVIDPHGDLADDALASVPKHRVKDVVLFDPSDRDNPVALNMFDNEDPNKKPLIASGIVAVLKKLNADSWGPRLEYILRNTTLALLDFPGSTFLGILRMYTDEYFRNRVVKEIQDPVVKRFWIEEFGKLEQKQILEQVGSIQNKVGQFLSNSIIRNILGQTKSSIDIRKIMDEGKILIVNLSKGKIGEDNATLLGSMLITKIQLDVMGRADMKEEDRKDFYLYVDEFQNFATDSFGTILSEARKYKLNLTMANQYVAQMPDSVRDAVFGNIGSMVTFQVGVDDTPLFVRQYGEQVTETDLMEIGKFKYYTRMLINGMPSNPFSVDALPPPRDEVDHNTIIEAIRYSRDNYTKKSSEVEEEIDSWEKKYEDPKKGEKEKKLADKKSAYEAKKAQLIKEGKWDPAGFNKKKNG